MSTLLLSIHPRHVDAMRRGKKTVELRKVRPRLGVTRVLVYETAPKALVGSFIVDTAFGGPLGYLRGLTAGRDGVSRAEFFDYFGACDYGFVFSFTEFVSLPRRIVRRACRDHLPTFRPPQSYRYLDDDELRLLLRDQYCEVAS